MENPMLNAAAQPFQPGKPPAAPRSNSFQNSPANGGGPNARNGATGGFLPPHVLSQIHNQIAAGSPRQGGAMMPMPMSAQSRPFVPGNPAPPQMHGPVSAQPPPPSLQPMPFQPAAASPVLPRPIPPRLGHGMNPGSVQLTGLQTFLGGAPGGLPLSISPNSQPHLMNGPASPMTPGGQPSPSPFMFPPGQAAMGPNRGGKHRKGKGPAPITPLKTTGHNSTPSISLNPAAFAASLAAAKAKKKVVVTIPKEGPVPEDEETLSRQPEELGADEVEADVDEDEAEEKRLERTKLRAAQEAAATRSKWIRREPWEELDLDWSLEMPDEAMVSCEIHPEPWPLSLGLPDTIDIYLPGLSAWDEYHEIRMEERQAEAEAEALAQMQSQAAGPNQESVLGINSWPNEAINGGRSKSMSVSNAVDPSMVSFKLNRYLSSQDAPEGDPNLPSAGEVAKAAGIGRFQDNLPLKLREAFARRQAEAIEARARSGSGHGYTMSLGLPSSGGPFGPAALSALELIRANSDGGHTEPAMGDRPVPDKEISEPALSQRRSSENSLAGIDEESEESEGEMEGERQTKTGKHAGLQALARGFGYDLEGEDEEVTPRLPSTVEGHPFHRHSRQTSRISVSTSRAGGNGGGADEDDGDDELDEVDEVRTNPSEDADASDFEEEIDSDVEAFADGQHWSRRNNGRPDDFGSGQKHPGGGYYDDLSDMSADEQLQDSLTPSDEQFSNPSDEEAAREERLMRRQHRAALRAARHESRRRRARSGTNNTLPSSSIGEADTVDQSLTKRQPGWPYPGQTLASRVEQDEIISNPSDEIQSDFDECGTFGGPLDHRHATGERLSQDFRFPAPQHGDRRASQQLRGQEMQTHSAASPFKFKPAQAETLGRSAGASFLDPGAEDFRFGQPDGGSAASHAAVSAGKTAVDSVPDPSGHLPHFRLPSINNSSFGSSTFGDVVTRAQGAQPGNGIATSSSSVHARPAGLSATAPTFTPESFTFTAPGAPRLEMPSEASPSSGIAIKVEPAEGEGRGAQGREKRQKFGPIDSFSDDNDNDNEMLRPESPPRLRGSTASIEGPLRDFGSFAGRGPPPFNPNGVSSQRTASGSRFKPDAPVFTPSWSRATSLTASAARRPGLPDFGFGAVEEASQAPVSLSLFAFNAGSKAVPIRRPSEDHAAANIEQQSAQHGGLGVGRKEADVPSNEIDHSVDLASEKGGVQPVRQTAGGALDPEKTPLASIWDRAKLDNRVESSPYGRSPTKAGSRRAPIYDQRGAMAVPVAMDTQPMSRKQRILHNHTLSRDSAGPSEDGRMSRRNGHHAAHLPNSFDADEESLTDFIEELAERMDKALEGWAGKILDEVTIMGQVRPVHRPGSDALDKEQLIETFSRRVEDLMGEYVARVEQAAVAARSSLENRSNGSSSSSSSAGAADDSQSTIRAIAAADRHQGMSTLDAAGELDFDYVQEILDVKVQNLQEELKRTFTEALGAQGQSRGEREGSEDPSETSPRPTLELSAEASEQLAALMSDRLSSVLGDHSRTQLSEHREQLTSILEPALEEHAARAQNKAAADRLEIAHQVVDQIRGSVEGWNRDMADMRSSFVDQMQLALINHLVPHLETLRTEPVDGDVIAARVTEILAPMISDERERRRSERRESEELVRSPSFTADAVAEETLNRLKPIVSSLQSEPIDSDALVQRLGEVIGKQSIEHLVDLSPVLALLEPIIAKQEDIRSFTKKMIERQEEVERTMSELPGAINAKTEIFLSAAGQTQEASASILSRVESLHELQAKAATVPDRTEREAELADQLQSSRGEADRLRLELEAVRAELGSAKDERSGLRIEVARLEGRLGEAERDARQMAEQVAELKPKEAEAAEAGRKLEQAEAGLREAELVGQGAAKEAATLQAHVEQLATELREAREERARERESAAQATAEALARAGRAERQASETEARANERVDASLAAERRAQESVQAATERAAKAEGQLAVLEKRTAEQEGKLASLQALSAAQKQQTATNQQKLSEAEKRTREFEEQARELAVALARLEELEDRVKDDEELRERLREAQDGESRLRGEVAQYHARFSELEKDLITMKESLVGRNELEACQAELGESREEVARLKGRLMERDRVQAHGWVEVTRRTAAEGAAASMHAPPVVRIEAEPYGGEGDAAGDDGHGRPRRAGAVGGVVREVEQDDGGWWS